MLHHSSSVHLLTRDLISPGFSGNKFNFSGSDNQRVSHKKSFPALHLNVKPFLNKVEDCPAQYFPDNKTPFFHGPLSIIRPIPGGSLFQSFLFPFNQDLHVQRIIYLSRATLHLSVLCPQKKGETGILSECDLCVCLCLQPSEMSLYIEKINKKKYYMLLKLNLNELKIADKKKAQPLVKICLSNDLLHLKTIFLLHSTLENK